MVKKLLIFKFLVVFALSAFAVNAQFSAKVNTDKIATNEVVTLNIELNNTVSKSNIDFSELQKSFEILSTSNAASVEIINGQSSATQHWTLVLKPHKDGTLKIPSFKLITSAGELLTDPINVEVTKAVISNSARNGTIFVTSNVSNLKPYLNEPVIYQIQLYSVTDQHIEFSLGDLKIDNALYKPLGPYKVTDGHRAGKPVKIVEMTYLITPSKAGKVVIPSQIISGVVSYIQRKRAAFSSLLGLDWGDSNDQNAPTNHKQHFQVATNEINLEVQPAVKGNSPWLPAKSLDIAANLGDNKFMVGVPIKLSIDITAKGLEKNQLPHIGVDALKGDGYKIYAENIDTADSQDKLPITASRREVYTIIPQKEGKITIPEIAIKWWNTEKKQAATAIISSHRLEILPNNNRADNAGNNNNTIPQQDNNIVNDRNDQNMQDVTISGFQLVWMLGGIICGIIIAFAYLLVRNNKNKNANSFDASAQLHNNMAVNAGLEISNVKSASDLYKFLQTYANQSCGVPTNSSLSIIFNALIKHRAITQEESNNIIKELEGALYADKVIDIELLKAKCKNILKRPSKSVIFKGNKKGLPDLNP